MRVVVAGRRQEKNQQVAEQLREEYGVDVCAVQADVSREGDCQALVDAAQREFGRLDVLINNAGKGGGGERIAESRSEDLR
jgi:NAD(P)-dependent dehydrogenase (short-subunit alcohol dehydrogenase family)